MNMLNPEPMNMLNLLDTVLNQREEW